VLFVGAAVVVQHPRASRFADTEPRETQAC